MVRDTVSFVAYTELLKLGRKAAMTHYAMQPDDAPPGPSAVKGLGQGISWG